MGNKQHRRFQSSVTLYYRVDISELSPVQRIAPEGKVKASTRTPPKAGTKIKKLEICLTTGAAILMKSGRNACHE